MEDNVHTGLFPALLEPAKAAAKELLGLVDRRRKIKADDGLFVIRKESYDPSDGENIHEFELDGDMFIICEPY